VSGRLGFVRVDSSAGLDVLLFQAIPRDLVEVGSARRAVLFYLVTTITEVEMLGTRLVGI